MIEAYNQEIYVALLGKSLYQRFEVIFNAAIVNSHYYKKLISNSLGQEQNIKTLVDKKLIHSLAAIDYFNKVLKLSKANVELSDDTILAILIFEFLEVDIADTLGEIESLRNLHDQNYLFKSLKNAAIYGQKATYFPKEIVSDNESLRYWNLFLNELAIKFHEVLSGYKSWGFAREIVDRRLTEYYSFIIVDHVRSTKDKLAIKSKLIRETFKKNPDDGWKPVPEWVESSDLWLNFLGDSISFLVPIFLSIEFNELITREFLVDMIIAFRGVGILNVWLDDLLDLEEDSSKNDMNLFSLIETGKLKDKIFALGNPYNSFSSNIMKQIDYDFNMVYINKEYNKLSTLIKSLAIIKTLMPRLYLSIAEFKKVKVDQLELITNITKL